MRNTQIATANPLRTLTRKALGENRIWIASTEDNGVVRANHTDLDDHRPSLILRTGDGLVGILSSYTGISADHWWRETCGRENHNTVD